MSHYEWISSTISALSLFITIFFSLQVYKISRQANDISAETLIIQKQQLAHDLSKKHKNVDNNAKNEELENESNVNETNETVLELNNNYNKNVKK